MEKLTAKQKAASFGKFIWNKDEGTILGRGARSWGEISLFYIIYYICLSGFFIATIAVFYQTLDDDVPALLGSSSLLKGNPGLGIVPKFEKKDLKINSKPDAKGYKSYTEGIQKFIDGYAKSGLTDCSGIDKPRLGEKTPCAFDSANVTQCSSANGFGMADSEPCILLKLNKVYGWSPEMWDAAEAADSSLPEEVKNKYDATKIWVHCKGRKSEDEKKMENVKIEYFPEQGFPVAFFPYLKQKDYLNPLVFVKFSNVEKDNTIRVECRVYAKNIDFDRTEKQGGFDFELNVK